MHQPKVIEYEHLIGPQRNLQYISLVVHNAHESLHRPVKSQYVVAAQMVHVYFVVDVVSYLKVTVVYLV